MKKIFVLMIGLSLIFTMVGCGNNKQVSEIRKWDCSVACENESSSDEAVITYSDVKVSSQTGTLTFQNQNDFDIVIYLLAEGAAEQVLEVPAGGAASLYQVIKDTEYTVGVHGDVSGETTIELMVYDGRETEVY